MPVLIVFDFTMFKLGLGQWDFNHVADHPQTSQAGRHVFTVLGAAQRCWAATLGLLLSQCWDRTPPGHWSECPVLWSLRLPLATLLVLN